MPQVLGQNDDGTFTVQRDDGSTVRVGRLPPSLAAAPAMGMDLPRIAPGSTGAPAPMVGATPPPAGAVPPAQMAALADFAQVTKQASAPPPPGAMPVARGPSAVDALVDSVGMGVPKPRAGPPTEFAGFRGDPATMARNAATGSWSAGGVHTTPGTARPDPIPLPPAPAPATPEGPLGRDAFVDGGGTPGAAPGGPGGAAGGLTTLVRTGSNASEKELRKALNGLQEATAERIATEAAQAQVRAAGMETETVLAERREARRLERQAQRDAAAKAEEDKLRAVLGEAEKPPPEIDPDRLWKSKNTGQKILAVLMEGFHGFAAGMRGQRHESRLRAIIQEDIALQRDAIQRAGDSAKAKVANQNLLLATMRERFGDEIASEKAAEAYAFTMAQQRLQTLLAKTEDETKVAAGQEELSKLEVHKQNALQEFRARNLQLAMQLEERQARLAAAAAGPAAKPGAQVPAGEASQVGELVAARTALAQLRKSFREKTGLVSGVTQYLPGTDAALYSDEVYTTAQAVGTILEGGKLTDADFPKYLRMLPSAGDSRERADAKIANLTRLLDGRTKGKVKGLGAAGFNTTGLQGLQGPASLQRKQ